MGQSACTSVRYSGVHPKPCGDAMSVDCTPCCIRLASSVVADVEPKGCLEEPGGGTVYEGALLEAELPHDPNGMVLHTSGESWQHHKSRIAGVKEDSERLSRGWNDAPCYSVVRQL